MITLTILVMTRTWWTVIVSSWQRKYVTGKEEEDGYPSQEMVIYGSSRSSPRSHSAVGGNFDPQVTITIINITNITNSISLLTSHHISSPHWQNLSQKLTEWRALLKKSLCWWLAPRYWWRYILSILYSWLESLKQCLHLCCQISNSNHPDEITASFRRFGPLVVDWPHKVARNIYFSLLFYSFFFGGGRK